MSKQLERIFKMVSQSIQNGNIDSAKRVSESLLRSAVSERQAVKIQAELNKIWGV